MHSSWVFLLESAEFGQATFIPYDVPNGSDCILHVKMLIYQGIHGLQELGMRETDDAGPQCLSA